MEQESYSSYEVIVALQNIGISQEIIEYVVPIAGYESRVEGTLFTRDALDKLSPSWGIFQANVDSMAPGIYKAMNELGVDIPDMPDEQKKVLIGSHIDTVPAGGRFDGVAGIIAALEVVHYLNRNAIELPFDLTLVTLNPIPPAYFEIIAQSFTVEYIPSMLSPFVVRRKQLDN